MRSLLKLALVVAVVAGGVVAWQRYSAPGPIAVRLAPVERGTVESTVTNTRAGTVKACRRSKLSPRIGGQVSRLPVREGDRVSTGQVLLVLWNEDAQARLDLAAGEADVAEARASEACLTAEVAAREARRLEKLATQHLVAEEQSDRATTEARAREAACRGAQASREVAKANTKAARAAFDTTFLKAPFDGIVAEVNAEIGEFVTPSPPGIPTPPAVDLIDARCVFVTAPIDEVDAPAIRERMPACVSLDAFPERRCGAHVRRIAPYVLDREKQARTVEVEVEFAAGAEVERMLPGYTADVEIVLERHDDVVRVPTEALLEDDRVLVYVGQDVPVEARTLRRGLSNWRFTEVLEGLEPGEQIVLSIDREGVEPGALVQPE